MQLDVESLRAFLAVLDTGGMTAAANSIGLSQSAVSWKIKRLEQRVGRELLIREGHSLRPTRDGTLVLDHARQIVGMHDELVARLSSSELTGIVTFGTTEELSAFCVDAVLGRFNRVHPGATIEFRIEKSRELGRLVETGQLDVAVLQIGIDDVQRTDTVLWEDELAWVSAPDWTYDVGEVPLVSFGRDGFYHRFATQRLKEASIPTRVALSAPSTASVLAAVASGLGVAVVSRRLIDDTVIEWPRAAGLPDLPTGATVARSSPGEDSAIARELIADIESELLGYEA